MTTRRGSVRPPATVKHLGRKSGSERKSDSKPGQSTQRRTPAATGILEARSKSKNMAKEINRADASAVVGGVDGAKPQGGAKAQGGESLDKVRDILFGSQAREYERRFARLEERLLKEASDLRDEVRKRFDALEVYTRKEVESLAARLKTEHEQRTESAKEISRELKETSRTLEKKTGQLDEQLSASQRELREQILNQSKSISDEIHRKHEAMAASLDRATAELRDEKTDRAALASLFMEVAMRLNNEFKIPDAEDLE